MNERIRELREQAWTLVSNEERDRGALYDAREQWERCDQKFAELIVRECATAIITDSRLNDVRSAANGCVRTIREHFGVEE